MFTLCVLAPLVPRTVCWLTRRGAPSTTLTNGDTAILIRMAKNADFAFDMHIWCVLRCRPPAFLLEGRP